MLQVAGVHKSYAEVRALRGVDLQIAQGEIVGLLGPNGAGKTTLVSIIAGLRRPDSGSVRIANVDALAHPQRARSYLGLAPQDLGIYPVITVRDNLVLFGELAGIGGKDLALRIDQVGEALHLVPMFHRLARTLSGGEKRRLHTAIALLHRPPLLLLDEPTTGADVRSRAEVLDVVHDLAGQGSAILYSTHYLHEVESLGASVAIIDEGKIIARGALGDLIASHGTSAVEMSFDGVPPAIALGDANVSVEGSRMRIIADDPAAAAARALTAIGPEAHRLRSIEIVHPSLEGVFLSLTGRRYASGEGSDEEEQDVATA